MFELSAHDPEAARQFYSSLFGWQSADNPNSPVGVYTMFLHKGHDVAGLYRQFQPQIDAGFAPFWDLYVAVPDADAAAARAAELGGKIVMPPFDVAGFGRMAVISDPTGAVFCVWQAKTLIGVAVKNEPGSFCRADLSTPDPSAAAAFYTALFGWTTFPGDSGYLHLMSGEEFIGGIPPAHNRPGMRPHWMSYIQVADCDAAAARARELGAKIFREPTSPGNAGRMCILADPQGAVFALFALSAPLESKS